MAKLPNKSADASTQQSNSQQSVSDDEVLAERLASATAKTISGKVSPLDLGLFLEILKTAGLPGLVICVWLISLITGSDNSGNLVMWGALLASASAVNFFMFQMTAWRDSIVNAVQGAVNQTAIQTAEVLEILMTAQSQTVKNLATIIAIQEGGLTLNQMQKVVLPHLCEAIKWKLASVCLSALDPLITGAVARGDMQTAAEIQIKAMLKQLSAYNVIMGHDEVLTIIQNSVENIFKVVYSEDQMFIDNYATKVHNVVEIIRVEMDACYTQLMAFMKGQLDLSEKLVQKI